MAEAGLDREKTPSLPWRRKALVLVFGCFLILDQVTKLIVRQLVVDGSWSMPFIPGILRFEFVANRGASFGMGQGYGLAFAVLAVAVSVAIVWYIDRAPALSKVEIFGLAMVAGGAVGNMFDRLVYGYVTDFLCTEFISFPVFNIADIGITCGVAIALIGFLILSPANKVDAAAESSRRDAEAAEERARRATERDGR